MSDLENEEKPQETKEPLKAKKGQPVTCVRVIQKTPKKVFKVGNRSLRCQLGDIYHNDLAQWLWDNFREFVEVFPKK